MKVNLRTRMILINYVLRGLKEPLKGGRRGGGSFKKLRKYFKRGHFFRGDLSWEVGGTLPKIVINLPRIYEKLHCKGEPYRLSEQ